MLYLTKQQGISDFTHQIGVFTTFNIKFKIFHGRRFWFCLECLQLLKFYPLLRASRCSGCPNSGWNHLGVIDTSADCAGVRTWQLTSVNTLGVTNYSKFPCWVLCCSVRRVPCSCLERICVPRGGFHFKNYTAYFTTAIYKWMKVDIFLALARLSKEEKQRACSWQGRVLEVQRNPTHAAAPGNSTAGLEAGTQELWGWEMNFRWLWNVPPR